MLTVTLLGATGSIGKSTLDLIQQHPDKFRIGALVAGRDVAGLARLAADLRPDFVALADESTGPALREALAQTGIRNGAGRPPCWRRWPATPTSWWRR